MQNRHDKQNESFDERRVGSNRVEKMWLAAREAKPQTRNSMPSETAEAHVDGSSQRKEVVRTKNIRFSVRPDMRQVVDLEREFTCVSWEGTGDGEIE